MRDDSDVLDRLKRDYPNVLFQGRTKRVPSLPEATEEAGTKIDAVVQFWHIVRLDCIRARVARPVKKRYTPIQDVEAQINDVLVSKSARRIENKTSATRFGQDLVLMLNGSFRWATSKYLAVHLPASGDVGLKAWSGWLRFMNWAGKTPRQRRWSEEQRERLHAAGQYAWLVMLDRVNEKAKAYYACEGSSSSFSSQWFALENPQDLHRMMLLLDRHADEFGWRKKELQQNLNLVPRVKEEILMPRSDARVEVTRVPDLEKPVKAEPKLDPVAEANIDDLMKDFIDPLSPPGWCGDLGKRYAD